MRSSDPAAGCPAGRADPFGRRRCAVWPSADTVASNRVLAGPCTDSAATRCRRQGRSEMFLRCVLLLDETQAYAGHYVYLQTHADVAFSSSQSSPPFGPGRLDSPRHCGQDIRVPLRKIQCESLPQAFRDHQPFRHRMDGRKVPYDQKTIKASSAVCSSAAAPLGQLLYGRMARRLVAPLS